MRSKVRGLLVIVLVTTLALALAACATPPSGTAEEAAPEAGEAGGGTIEIFSWWTSGGEVEALNALYEIFSAEYPDVEVENAALAGGAGQGGNMKALLETRMLGGEPPDSFQVHLGRELIDSHVIAGRMEPLDFLFEDEGLYDVFPQDLIDIASYEGSPYSVPVNIHRSNNVWFRPSRLAEAGFDAPPATWDEFFAMAEELKAAGVPAIAIAGGDPNFNGHLLENILVATLGPADYRGLFDGSVGWDDPRVTEALEILNKTWDYTEDDYLSIAWGDINDRFVADNGPAMMIMGDWTHGVMKSKGFEDYRWSLAPGTQDLFVVLSDSFGLPQGAPHRENAIAFLKIVGSREGQDAFNPPKGSIPARIDADPSVYDEYQLSAIEDFAAHELVPSLQHGAAAKQSFLLDYDVAVNELLGTRDVAKAQEMMVAAAEVAAFGE